MLLAIDIGNSLTKFGIFDSSTLVDKFSIPTERDYSPDELLFDRLRKNGSRFLTYDTIAVSSVVPQLEETFRKAFTASLNVIPCFIDHTYDLGLQIKYKPASTAGIDRLINASAAAEKYGAPVIACSFGTATTFDVVNGKMEYLGGAIAPGLRVLSHALHLKTAKLPEVNVEEPAKVIGATTEASISSGIFFGYIGMAEGILKRMLAELGRSAKVIGTGGFAPIVGGKSSVIDVVDENLTLNGIRMIAERRDRARSAIRTGE
ncbi:MAG: type III pantothenate kinase [Acidobacteria bacterium]|nr:type III pantothenate kinase [Acidobacteriota bacterium]